MSIINEIETYVGNIGSVDHHPILGDSNIMDGDLRHDIQHFQRRDFPPHMDSDIAHSHTLCRWNIPNRCGTLPKRQALGSSSRTGRRPCCWYSDILPCDFVRYIQRSGRMDFQRRTDSHRFHCDKPRWLDSPCLIYILRHGLKSVIGMS